MRYKIVKYICGILIMVAVLILAFRQRLLMYSINTNKYKLTYAMLYLGTPVNERFDGRFTPLFNAIYTDDDKLITLLIRFHADMEFHEQQTDYTLLDVAISEKKFYAMKSLVLNGANINSQTKSGFTPLHIAASMGLSGFTEFLLQHKANTMIKDNVGNIPLHDAKNAETAKLLLQYGSNIEERNRRGATPLIEQAENLGDHFDVVKFLVEHNANVNVKDNYGRTPLHYADSIRIAKYLVSKGADIRAKAIDGSTPAQLLGKSREEVSIYLKCFDTDD